MKQKPGHGVAVALVDPTSLAGRDVRAVLHERAFPVSSTRLFHTGELEEGILAEDEGEARFVSPLGPSDLEGCGLAFLCGPPSATARFLERRQPDGCVAIDLSGSRAGGALVDFTLLGEAAELPSGDLLRLPDPAALVLAEAVQALDRLAPVEALSVAVDRPVSDLGKRACDELFQQALALATFRTLPKEVLGTQAAFNLFVAGDSASFERNLETDLQALLGRDLPTSVLSLRAGVFHCHTLRVEARFASPAPPARAVRAALKGTEGAFDEPADEEHSGTIDAAGRDETILLRCDSRGHRLLLTLVSDHLRRPGALLAVQLAERLVRERGLLADA